MWSVNDGGLCMDLLSVEELNENSLVGLLMSCLH